MGSLPLESCKGKRGRAVLLIQYTQDGGESAQPRKQLAHRMQYIYIVHHGRRAAPSTSRTAPIIISKKTLVQNSNTKTERERDKETEKNTRLAEAHTGALALHWLFLDVTPR